MAKDAAAVSALELWSSRCASHSYLTHCTQIYTASAL